MHARATTFQARPGSIDDGIAFCRDEVLPLIRDIDGCIGLSMMVDRTTGRCIATSAWENEETMRASDGQLAAIRDRAGEILGADPEVEEWEITALHRDHRTADGACTRVSWMDGQPGEADRMVEVFRGVLPTLESWGGFCSASLLVNRSRGRAVITTTWDSQAALEQTRPLADRTRAQAAEESGTRISEVAEFELAVAHLRVPELI
ncbi:antibiotic biosynthesis monooxygenase [uncultured Phycicoccus sp.]|uniref:antibiotic biosynthesis monooxygenase n=1 Tax=uncultured Phycicoccus sp. TaxID=661422 RepID=UPI0026072B76|nr:antibiotic biosynthesis monooxygenase [uncultured Phycicoccus sp.]